jgi:glutaredoxin
MEDLTVKELKEISKRYSIQYSNMTKQELINAIKKARILNPNTGRYVNKTGELGQILVKGFVIYTKEGCGYCEETVKFLNLNKQKYIKVKVTPSNKDKIYNKIDKLTNSYRYFPIIFKKNKFIGGFSELEKLNLST